MAVAVKTSQGARSTGPLASAAILSLVGVVYLLACLAIVFWLIPGLWWSAWEAAVGPGAYAFVGGSLLGILGLAVGVALLVVGARLLGPSPPVGVRAGVFVGFLGLLLVALLTRWASLWAEHWAYQGLISSSAGLIGTVIFGAVLLLGWLRLFTRPAVQKFVVGLEQAGWFHATAYKSNQGQKVRRGTIAGILLVVGAGIYTLISHNILGRGAPEWKINLPFTGVVAIESYGDMRGIIARSDAAKNEVEIRWPGENTGFAKGQHVRFDAYKAKVPEEVRGDADATAALSEATEPTAFLLAVNEKVLGKQMQKLLEDRVVFPEGETRRLELKFNTTPWEDLGDIAADFYRAGQQINRQDPLKVVGAAFAIPSAVPLLDRYALRDINARAAEDENVKVVLKGDSNFSEGEVVSAKQFDDEVARLEELRKKGRDRVLPTKTSLAPAAGKTEYAGITLLPSVQFTVPLLLLAGSLWLAWRVVNMPTFADFLIATEAELNKVSWTTQKRLVQDTIVVLVTVLLMAIFLFGMDLTWKEVLSWKPIGVLHVPKEESQQNKSFENKRY
jgi:preprotein translocase SecE subunit